MPARPTRRRSTQPTLAAVLAFTIVCTAAAIGLYRPEICIERRRLLINAGVAGLLAFPAVLVVSGSFNIGLSRHAVLLLSKVLVVWLVCIMTSRLIFNRIMRERWFIRRILVLGSAPRIARLRQLATGGRGRLFEPVVAARDAGAGVVDPPLSLDALRRQRIWGIVVAGSPADPDSLPVQALLDCKLRGVPVLDEAGFCEQHLGRIDLDSIRADWLLFADGFANGALQQCRQARLRHRRQSGAAAADAAADAADRGADPAGQSGAGALPPAARRAAWQAVHAAQVPQHVDRRREGRQSALGDPAGPSHHPGRQLHPADAHRRAAAAHQRAARRDEHDRAAPGAAAFRRAACPDHPVLYASAATSSRASPAGRR